MSLLITGCTQGVPELPDFDLHFDVEEVEIEEPTPDPDDWAEYDELLELAYDDDFFLDTDPNDTRY